MKPATLVTIVQRALATAVVPFTLVACCGGVDDPDDQLQVEVAGPTEQSIEGAPESLCGANVVARDTDGAEIPLEETVVENSDGSARCVYRGTVDPEVSYTIEARHTELGMVAYDGFGDSNPSCSTRTDPDDTDNRLVLEQMQRAPAPSGPLTPLQDVPLPERQ